MRTEKRTTPLGTPCAHSWSDEWIAAIEATENDLNRRICGARRPDATPCTNESNHPSGRCPFHGGFDLTGAPPGNRHAAIHGMYSRRLRTCNESCPHWQTCPVAAQFRNAAASTVPIDPTDPSPFCGTRNPEPDTRLPIICPYQQIEYNTVLTDALAVVESQPHQNPLGIHNAHNTAMLQVLVNEGASRLANMNFADDFPDPTPHTPNPNANTHDSRAAQAYNVNAVNAFVRLLRELRASRKELASPTAAPLFRQKNEGVSPVPDAVLRHVQRMQHDTDLDPDSLADTHLPPETQQQHAKAYLQDSIQAASVGRDVEMSEAFDNVIILDESLAIAERDHVLASYRPAKHSVSEDLAAQILGYLHLPPRPEEAPLSPSTTSIELDESTDIDGAKILKEYLDIFRDGKLPPETFPIGSAQRAYAESIYTGPS